MKRQIGERLFYSWGGYDFGKRKLSVFDTTLRDGLQSAQIKKQPTLSEKVDFLQACHELGIEAVELGFPVASIRHKEEVMALAKYVRDNKLKLLLSCLSRTLTQDVEAVAEVSQRAGVTITVNLLVGSSKIRQIVENWKLPEIKKWVKDSILLAKKYNLPVEFVTEDTTRSHPAILKQLYSLAINLGVNRVWIADTVGETTPNAAQNIARYFKKEIIGKRKVGLDWHGHEDKGLGVACSLAALESGADRVQATALAVGERAGNTPMEPVLINLFLAGQKQYNLKKLENYSLAAAKMYGLTIRENYPGIGKLVHATAAGMHAAAILKAKKMKRPDLEGLVYSSFHPELVGREVEILIGPMSGSANVEWNLKKMALSYDNTSIQEILDKAKTDNIYISPNNLASLLKN